VTHKMHRSPSFQIYFQNLNKAYFISIVSLTKKFENKKF